MVGRTRLYRKIRSPLIHGYTKARRRVWPWLLLAVVLAGAGVWAYLTYMP